MKTKRIITLWLAPAAFAILILQTSSAAPLGTAFTYQGQLNSGANPANGIYDLRFTIYDLRFRRRWQRRERADDEQRHRDYERPVHGYA